MRHEKQPCGVFWLSVENQEMFVDRTSPSVFAVSVSTELERRLQSRINRISRQARRLQRIAAFQAGKLPMRERKVFCIAMQRTGTTSFGQFCANELGLVHRGFEASIANGWTRSWMNGDYERVFRSPDFLTGEVFEDDPWWCPRFYELLAERFPESRFVLITRDENAWFRSMLAHSNGRTPGRSYLSAISL